MFRLPMLFIATGIASFILFHVFSLVTLGTWAAEPMRNTDGLFRVHLLVLDWATMIAMGAVYQLIDVVLQRRIYSRVLGYIHYGFFTAGSLGLLIGFYQGEVSIIAASAVFAVIGIFLFAWNTLRTILGAKQWNAITISTLCAVVYLIFTGLLGLAMGLNFAFNLWGSWHEKILHAHIWFGTLGWFGLLITGFSYKMLPMFYLSHGAPEKPQQVVLVLWNAGVLAGAISFLFKLGIFFTGFSVVLLFAALLVYDQHLNQIRQRRHKSSPGRGIWWTIVCTRALIIYTAGLLSVWLAAPDRLWSANFVLLSSWIYLWGWVAMTILGYMSKIVPFLWWTKKYGNQAGKPGVPVMSDLISDKQTGIGLAGIAAGLIVTAAGIGLQSAYWTSAGASLISLGSLFYIGLIARVFTK